VRLASIADRINRPFAAVLEQDELEALVEPAVAELFTGDPATAGLRLEERATEFLGLASGSGVEVPEWLERLGNVVDRSLERAEAGAPWQSSAGLLPDSVPWLDLPWESLRAALGPGGTTTS